jgi:hypothetical protein
MVNALAPSDLRLNPIRNVKLRKQEHTMEIVNAIPKRRGRPPGSKNKPKIVTDTTPKRRGRPLGSKNKRGEQWDTWECPSCKDKVETMPGVAEVAHHCPQRDIQPAPAKGKKRLLVIVNYELIQVPDQDRCVTLSAQKIAVAKKQPGRPTGSRNQPKTAEGAENIPRV